VIASLASNRAEGTEIKMTICPQCSSRKILWRAGGVSDWLTYLCTNCGHLENYPAHRAWLAGSEADPQQSEWRSPE
jgi:RNase P subunit RPR2